ncbi:hypothetical protein [Vogesella indigofera]|uniref:hypothetical protein n=1 Tax=Vogesella indigofera TaxID=45465 RepID=UPI0035AD9EF1
MTSCEEVIRKLIDKIKKKEVPLYQAIPIKDFAITFASEFIAASELLEQLGIKDFLVKTTNGFTTIQTFNIASTLTFLKIHNEQLNIDDFLSGIDEKKDGAFQFGYLLSSTIGSHLKISEDIEIAPYRDARPNLTAVNRHEINDFLDHTSPEFNINREKLAVILIKIPLQQMVFDKAPEDYDIKPVPGMLASQKLREVQELISLISNRAIKILASWGSYSDERLDYLLGLNPYKNRDYYSDGGFAFFQSCMAETEWNKSKAFFDLILKAEQSKELKVALDRVYSSIGNDDFMGKVLDLAIAMEVMCVSGRGDNTYKVATHISWLCSTDKDERLNIMKCIKDFYSLRSSIVHEGSYSKNATKYYGGEIKLYDLVLRYVKIALIKLLELGKKPDWSEVAANGGVLILQK